MHSAARRLFQLLNGHVIESAFLRTVLNEEKSVWTSNLTMERGTVQVRHRREVTAVSKETWLFAPRTIMLVPRNHRARVHLVSEARS